MNPSRCCCGARAEYSVCVPVSTLGLRPRRQKCGRAQVFCGTCIQKLLPDRWRMEAYGVQESLRQAYTAIAELSGPESLRIEHQNVLLIESKKLGQTSRR
jgi:hypothetical protein